MAYCLRPPHAPPCLPKLLILSETHGKHKMVTFRYTWLLAVFVCPSVLMFYSYCMSHYICLFVCVHSGYKLICYLEQVRFVLNLTMKNFSR
jgi:hypothetical protein